MKAMTSKGTISVIFGYRLADSLLLVGNFPTCIKKSEFKKQEYPKRLVNKRYNHKIKYCK